MLHCCSTLVCPVSSLFLQEHSLTQITGFDLLAESYSERSSRFADFHKSGILTFLRHPTSHQSARGFETTTFSICERWGNHRIRRCANHSGMHHNTWPPPWTPLQPATLACLPSNFALNLRGRRPCRMVQNSSLQCTVDNRRDEPILTSCLRPSNPLAVRFANYCDSVHVCEITWFVAAVLALIASTFSEKSGGVVFFCFLSFISVAVRRPALYTPPYFPPTVA